MGTTVEQLGPLVRASRKAVDSTGGVGAESILMKHTMGATYATGGDTIALPAAPPGCTLFAVHVISHNAGPGMTIVWDHSTSTPKLLWYDEDNTSGVAAEGGNGVNTLAAVVVFLELIYTRGR